jgi:hypothetical protein
VKGGRVIKGSRVAKSNKELLSTRNINIIKATKKTKMIVRKS